MTKQVDENVSSVAPLVFPLVFPVIVTKLLHELIRTTGRYGLATMCIGGGQGISTIWERV